MTDLGQKWAIRAPNGTNLGLFKISFQFILAQPKYINEIPRFVLSVVHLDYFGSKSIIRATGKAYVVTFTFMYDRNTRWRKIG